MEIPIQIAIALAFSGAVAIGILLYYHKQSPAIWTTYATIAIALSIPFFYWQDNVWKKEEAARVAAKESKPVDPSPVAPARPELEQPTFRESSAQVDIKMGTSHWNYPFADLLEGGVVPRPLSRPLPIKLYLDPETYKIYTDATIWAGSNEPAIELKRNIITTLRQSWDYNSNANALEVVNENQQPVFQLIYKAPSRIEINGIFVVTDGVIVADDSSTTYNPVPMKYSLKRIFKYPAWKYKGEYESP